MFQTNNPYQTFSICFSLYQYTNFFSIGSGYTVLQYIQGLLLNKMENWRGQELECTHPEIYFMNGTNIERLQQNVGAPLPIHRKSREGRQYVFDIFFFGSNLLQRGSKILV